MTMPLALHMGDKKNTSTFVHALPKKHHDEFRNLTYWSEIYSWISVRFLINRPFIQSLNTPDRIQSLFERASLRPCQVENLNWMGLPGWSGMVLGILGWVGWGPLPTGIKKVWRILPMPFWCPSWNMLTAVPAMRFNRSDSKIVEDELRDLLTYDCPITGRKRTPPSPRKASRAKVLKKLWQQINFFRLVCFERVHLIEIYNLNGTTLYCWEGFI